LIQVRFLLRLLLFKALPGKALFFDPNKNIELFLIFPLFYA
jgi:hypothetical protein